MDNDGRPYGAVRLPNEPLLMYTGCDKQIKTSIHVIDTIPYIPSCLGHDYSGYHLLVDTSYQILVKKRKKKKGKARRFSVGKS
jgi:hypothetical protein